MYRVIIMSTLNICQPGHGASCALCCGSHNYAATRDEIDALFRKRREALKGYSPEFLMKRIVASRSDMTGSYYFNRELNADFIITLPRLFGDGTQCPFVCHVDDTGVIGCAVYPGGGEKDFRYECFQSYTCKYFSCHAREVLADEEIDFAARLLGDWYYYTLLIHDIALLRSLLREFTSPEEVPAARLAALKDALARSLPEDRALHSLSSYFS